MSDAYHETSGDVEAICPRCGSELRRVSYRVLHCNHCLGEGSARDEAGSRDESTEEESGPERRGLAGDLLQADPEQVFDDE